MKLTLARILLSVFILNGLSCSLSPGYPQALDKAIKSTNPLISNVLSKPEHYEVQILYTQIDRIADSIILKDFEFRVKPGEYFYPASTVKLPITVLALEFLEADPRLNRNTQFYVEGDTVESKFSEEILKIFAVSDNDANNRFLELLGQDRINSRLKEIGVGQVRISHRLSVPNADEVSTQPIIVYLNDSTTTTLPPSVNQSPKPLKLKKIKKGKAHYAGDSLVKSAMDFSLKNYYPIRTQHEVLKRIIFPELFPPEKRFEISEDQREFLLNAMQILPRELQYDPEEFYDSYGKFFIYGDRLEPIPEPVQIFNKVGYAYGTLTECAYVLDSANEVEFMLTATILVNEDGIFNDDAYEYEEVGIPFLAALGREIYQYEKTRK